MMLSYNPKHRWARTIVTIVLAVLIAGLSQPVSAQPDAASAVPAAGAPEAPPIERLRSSWHESISRIKRLEWVENVTAVLGGSNMGPGDGWFHPGKSRYGWKWIAERFDRDGDQVVTADEFSGAAEMFQRLDRDGNGDLKADDFDWADSSPFLRQQLQAGQWFARLDKSSNGRITPEEWQQFFEKLAGEKGYVSREDLRSGLFPAAPKRTGAAPPANDGPTPELLLVGMLTGELGSMREGPAIDEPAPDFELETQDHRQSIRLSKFHGDKPVVLIFGSFT